VRDFEHQNLLKLKGFASFKVPHFGGFRGQKICSIDRLIWDYGRVFIVQSRDILQDLADVKPLA
jgi:hypothetical protein